VLIVEKKMAESNTPVSPFKQVAVATEDGSEVVWNSESNAERPTVTGEGKAVGNVGNGSQLAASVGAGARVSFKCQGAAIDIQGSPPK